MSSLSFESRFREWLVRMILWGLVGAALEVVTPCRAAEGDWSWQLTPYAWATGVGGTLRPFAGAPTVRIDKSFSDLNRDLDGAFFLSGLARRDRWVVVGDVSGSSSSRSGVTPPGIPAAGRLRQTSLTVALGYRLRDDAGFTLDLLAGARAWEVKAAVAVPPLNQRLEREVEFLDPILATRLNLRVAQRWTVLTYADVGGFGAGSESTSQLVLTANYRWREKMHLSGGYRWLHVDYGRGGSRIDVTAGGPLLGATFQF